MKKMCCALTGKLYEMKHQYPALIKLERKMDVVKRELNKEGDKKR